MKTSMYTGIALLMATMLSSGIRLSAQTNRSANSTRNQGESTIQQSDGSTRSPRRHSNDEADNKSSARQGVTSREHHQSGNAYQSKSNNKEHNSNQYGNADNRHHGNAQQNTSKGNNGNHYGHSNQHDKGNQYGRGNNGNDRGYSKDHGNYGNYKGHGKRDHPHSDQSYHGHNNDYYYNSGYYRHDDFQQHVYCQRLPGKKYHHYQFHGENYYHANGLFYKYYPTYGYYRVKCPYVIVASLPPHIMIRYYNGQRMAYYHGNYYLPIEYGWMLVPEVAAPQFSMNISINF